MLIRAINWNIVFIINVQDWKLDEIGSFFSFLYYIKFGVIRRDRLM